MSDATDRETALLDSFQMELRGYELARKTPSGWEQIGTYRPNDLARNKAIVAGRQLEWAARKRGRPEVYQVRPLVSLSVDFLARPAPPVDVPADAFVTPGELVLDSDQPREEESLIIKPEGDEFSGAGFRATPEQGAIGIVEIPYNYDQLAGSIGIPNPWGTNGEK